MAKREQADNQMMASLSHQTPDPFLAALTRTT